MRGVRRKHPETITVNIVLGIASCALAAAFTWSLSATAQMPVAGLPRYATSSEIIRPTDYREWVYVTSGLGMTYGPAQATAEPAPLFDNVFVGPEAYREFLRSGTWPDQTMFILEVRDADTNVSINNGGRTQGRLVRMEASVKDRQRFPDGGWSYFSFDSPQGLVDRAAPLPASAPCYSCHKIHTAVDNTFVQFYPTLLDVAKRLGTIKPDYDPGKKP